MKNHPASSSLVCYRAVVAWAASFVVLVVLSLKSIEVAASTPVGVRLPARVSALEIEQQVRQMAQDGLSQFASGPISRIEVQLGAIDSRLRLAPCEHVQTYVPTGSNLWGRTRIGLRCVQGEKAWNVFLPVNVRVISTALVSAGNLPAGHTLTQADLVQAEVDLAADSSAAVQEVNTALGRVLSRALGPGQSLRQSHLKARQWFAVGDVVTVVALGPGYRVVSQGEAMTPGLEGQAARVRLGSGRTLIGTPVADRQMELPL